MTCPKCEGKTKVLESRTVELLVARKRECLECGYRFFTEETEVEDNTAMKYYWSNSKATKRITKSITKTITKTGE